MKVPRSIGGIQLADHLVRRWEYVRLKQVGSHMMLRTETPFRNRQTIPAHDSLRIGTLHSIVKQVAAHKGVTPDAILQGINSLH